MHLVDAPDFFYFQPFTVFNFGTQEINTEEIGYAPREGYFVDCKGLRGYCGDYGYPIPTRHVYPTGYGVPCIDRISLKGLGLITKLLC